MPKAIDGDSRRDGRCHGEVGGVAEHVKERRELAHTRVVRGDLEVMEEGAVLECSGVGGAGRCSGLPCATSKGRSLGDVLGHHGERSMGCGMVCNERELLIAPSNSQQD